MFVCRHEEKIVVINEIAGLGGFLKSPIRVKKKERIQSHPRPEGAEARHKNADKISKNYLTKREFKNTSIEVPCPSNNWLINFETFISTNEIFLNIHYFDLEEII